MSTSFLSPGWRMPRNANQSKQSNYSMDFDGSSSVINLGNTDAVKLGAGDFTFSAWIYPYSWGGGYEGIYSNNSTNGVYIGKDGFGNFILRITNVSNVISYSTLPTVNTWTHICITRLNGTCTLYYNGSSVATGSSTHNFNSSTNVYIGGDPSSGTALMNGKIDAVAIFDYALSQSQVTTLYGSSSTGIGNPMALPNPPIAYYPLGGSAGAFRTPVNVNDQWLIENNAIGDYVFEIGAYPRLINTGTIADLNSNMAELSVSIWFKKTGGTRTNDYAILSKVGANTPTSFSLFWKRDSLATQGVNTAFKINNGSVQAVGGQSNTGNEVPITIEDNKWYNLVGTYNGTTQSLYINGVLHDFKSTTGNIVGVSGNALLGADSTIASYNWLGELSNSMIWTKGLSQSEVTTLYNYGSPIQTLASIPQNSNLKVWYKLDASEVYNSTTTEWIVGNSSGNYPTSLSFVKEADGSGNAITIYQGTDGNGPSNLKFGASDSFSISTWMYLNTRNSNKFAFTARGSFNAGAQSYNRLVASPNGVDKQLIYWSLRDDNNVSAIVNTTLATSGHPNDFVWANVVAVTDRSAQTIQIFVNGAGSPTANISSLGGFQNQDSIVIGNDGYTAQGGRYYYEGQLSNFAIFDKALTQSEINTLYNGGTPEVNISHSPVSWWKLDNLTTGLQDSAGGGNNATAASWITKTNNNVSTLAGISSGMSQANLVQSDLLTTTSYSPYALQFDGLSDKIDCGVSPFDETTGDITISAWVKRTAAAATYAPIVSATQGVASANTQFSFQFNGNSLSLFWKGLGGPELETVPTSAFTVANDVWYLVNFVRTGTTGRFYVNGNFIHLSTKTYDDFISTGIPNLSIGAWWFSSNASVTGSISNVALWNTSLSAVELREVYNEGRPSNLNNFSGTAPIRWWQLGSNSSFDGNDWIVADEKGTNNGDSTGMGVDALTNGVGTTANGVSSGMGVEALVGDAPYSTANAISSNMSVLAKGTDPADIPS